MMAVDKASGVLSEQLCLLAHFAEPSGVCLVVVTPLYRCLLAGSYCLTRCCLSWQHEG